MNMLKKVYTNREIGKRKEIAQSILIEHRECELVESELETLIVAGGASEAAKLTMFVAPSGCGKSTAVKQAVERLKVKPEIAANSLLPILYCKLPAKCAIKTMATALLYGLNDPLAERHSNGVNEMRIVNLLQAQRVKMLILDEFQELVPTLLHHNALEVTNWLKNVLDGAHVPVICVGLPESLAVVRLNKQLRRRTTKLMKMKPFEWDGGEESNRFKAFLHLYEKEMQFPDPSNLASADLAERIHIASDGLVGLVAQLIYEAIDVSMRRSSGPDCLTLEDFSEAYDDLPYEETISFRTPHCSRRLERTARQRFQPRGVRHHVCDA